MLDQLRAWLDESGLAGGARLPPERNLAELFGVKRAELRKALDVLEAEGRVWRHVGKGTFLTEERAASEADVAAIADRTSPPEAMEARRAVEPEIARLAALRATSAQIATMRDLCARMRTARTWPDYEDLDWRFHNLLAEAAGNTLLTEIQALLNGVRRAVVWGNLIRRPSGPPSDYHSFAEHEAIVAAVALRDRGGAGEAMRRHLDATASTMRDD